MNHSADDKSHALSEADRYRPLRGQIEFEGKP